MRRFKNVLDYFLNVSGAKVHNKKSHIYGWNVSIEQLQCISRILRFSSVEAWLYFKYLENPISLQNPPSHIWQEILDKMNKRIQQWGEIWLNIANKIILNNFVFPSLHCSTLLAP
jgi:hypothetical protein